MKTLIRWTAVALLATGCDKAEEKPSPVGAAPKPESKRRRVPTPTPGTDSAKPAAPPVSPGEVDAYFGELEVLAIQVESLEAPPAEGSPPPDIEALQKSYTALVKRRSELMAGMTVEEKRELAKRFLPSMKRIGPILMKHRLAKARERHKDVPPAQSTPGNVPAELLEELAVPSGENVPPAPRNGAPRPE